METIKEFSEDDDIVQHIRLCITRQRILNILSKGFKGEMNVTKLTFLMWKDIFNEFNDISKNFQKKIKKLYWKRSRRCYHTSITRTGRC